MREMQRIQPEVKKIQQKNKGDRQKMNEEMMALYREHGVNPFGGCLPLLLQFPVLIGLFYVIREPFKYLGPVKDSLLAQALTADPLGVHQFLGLRLDCSSQLALQGKASGIVKTVACGDGVISALPYLVLVLLMGFTTYYQQKQMQARQPAGGGDMQAQQLQLMGKIMPLMLMVFAFGFPSGVVIYWLTTNVWTIGQQQLMLRVAPEKPPLAPPTEPAYGNGNPPERPTKPHPSSKKKGKKR
jgi:YidC/Oxa1 family membrane protein insertase